MQTSPKVRQLRRQFLEILTSIGLHTKPQDPSWNSTGHIGSGVSAAATSLTVSQPSSVGLVASQTNLSIDRIPKKAAAVMLEHPRPLQPSRPSHTSLSGDRAMLYTNTILWSSRATFTSIGAGSLPSTDVSVDVVSATRGSLTAFRGGTTLAPASTDVSRVSQPSDATPDGALASGGNGSSIPTWSPSSPIVSLAPGKPTTRTTIPDSAILDSKNASASEKYMIAATGTGESPELVEFPGSIKNRTHNRTISHSWHEPKPNEGSLVYSPLQGLKNESYATPGGLIQTPPLLNATGSNRISSTTMNLMPLGTAGNSVLRHNLQSTDKNRTESRKSGRLKPHRPSAGLSPSGSSASTNGTGHYLGANASCSGKVTSTANVVYETVTSTIVVNETVTLGPNATIPLPVFITPSPACQTLTAPCNGLNCPPVIEPHRGPFPKQPLSPYTPRTTTSTLLVTKKSPAIVQQLSAVGNLFGPSTPTHQAVATQLNSDSQQTAGQDSGSSNPDMSTQSDDSSSSESDGDSQPPEKSSPQQNPTNGDSPSPASNSQNADSQKPGVGSSGGQSTGSDDQTASNGVRPNGPNSGHGDTSSNGDISSNGVTSASGSTGIGGGASSNVGVTNNEGASNHGSISSNGDIPSNGGASENGDSSSIEGGASSNGGVSSNGAASSDDYGPEPKAGSSADSHEIQYVPRIVMAGNLPVSMVSNAVIVGSHTISAGSPPTTVVANGQTIAIQPSQIVAQGKTIPIQAASTPPPTNSAMIGNVPVVLRPHDVAIGSKTFEHGPSPTSVNYDGQIYSWDATHLVGAGTTVAFPSTDPMVPRVTAGGRVFSVYPSQLKAPGKTILLPTIAKASPFVYQGRTYSVNPSQIIAPDTSITLPPANKVTPFVYIDHSLSLDASQFMARSKTMPLSSGCGIVTYNGQILTIKPSEVIGPSTTIALSAPDDSAASPTAVTTGGLTFSIGPSAAVVGSSTYSFVPGKAAATIMTDGEAVLVGSNGVQFGNFHVPIPTSTPSFSAVTQGDLTFSVAPSEVVIGGHTDKINADMTPITTVVHGHTISIGPKGVSLASTTIPLPEPKKSFSIATEGDLTFSIAPSEVVVEGKTYSLASNRPPITTAIDGQIMTIGPKGIHLEGTTVNLPVIQTPMIETAGGLTFSVGATDAVISGTTYAIGSGAPLQTVVVGSQTIKIGSAGVMLPSTTIAPEQTPSAITADGLTFSADSTEAVINGTTYAIGSGAVAKTIVDGSITMMLGTDGIALPSTTIRPWSIVAQTGFSSVLGTSGAASAATATGPLTPIVTGKDGNKKHAAGFSTRIPNGSTLMTLALGTLVLGLVLI